MWTSRKWNLTHDNKGSCAKLSHYIRQETSSLKKHITYFRQPLMQTFNDSQVHSHMQYGSLSRMACFPSPIVLVYKVGRSYDATTVVGLWSKPSAEEVRWVTASSWLCRPPRTSIQQKTLIPRLTRTGNMFRQQVNIKEIRSVKQISLPANSWLRQNPLKNLFVA